MDGQLEDLDFYTMEFSVPPVPVFFEEIPSAVDAGIAHTLTDMSVAPVPEFHEVTPTATDGMNFNADALQELDWTCHVMEPTPDVGEEPKDLVDAVPPPAPPKSARPRKEKAPKVKKQKFYERNPDDVSDPSEKYAITHAKKSRAYRQKINKTIEKAREIKERQQTYQDLLFLSFLEQMYGFSAKEIYDKKQQLCLWIKPVSPNTVTVEMNTVSNEGEVVAPEVINE